MATEVIELGTVSSRGQIAIPSEIRKELDLAEGTKVLFVLENDTLLIKKVTSETFESITAPLRQARKKLSEDDVPDLVHKLRRR